MNAYCCWIPDNISLLALDHVLREWGDKAFVGVGKVGVIGEGQLIVKAALLACCVAAVASLGASAAIRGTENDVSNPASIKLCAILLSCIVKPL